MGKTHVPYPPEIRRQMVELVGAGREPQDLSREFEPSAQAIRNWVHQAGRDEGRRADGLSTDERAELTRLRRENRQLRLERDIGPKAAAWFAGRPARSRPGLPIHDGEPGQLPGCRYGPRAWRLAGWLLCLVPA